MIANKNRKSGDIPISSDHAFAKDLILQHSFLNADLLNITLSNIGKRYDNKTQATLSSKITPTTWIQLDTKLYYTDYAKNELYARNRGCTFSTNASVEQELPYGIDLSVSGGYNTPYIYMQGKIAISTPHFRLACGGDLEN